MKISMILGVDPGQSGAIAVLRPLAKNQSEVLQTVFTMPGVENATATSKSRRYLDPVAITDKLLDVDDIGVQMEDGEVVAYIEQVTPMPKQGVASTGHFMKCAGIVTGICAGIGCRVVEVPAAKWKKALRLDSDKRKSLALARRIWPGVRFDTADQAEAALIGFYGMAMEKGEKGGYIMDDPPPDPVRKARNAKPKPGPASDPFAL